MRTVSGSILSSHPVSLSKAAKTLSHFAIADNEASPAITNYLKRASESFNELVRLHKELKGKCSESKKRSSGKKSDVQPTESVAYSEKNVGLDHSQVNGMGRTSSDRKSRTDVNGSMVSGERISKSRVVENDEFKVASIKKEMMEVQSPEAKIVVNGSEINSGEKMKKKKKRKKDAGREERSNSSVDASNLEHGHDRHRIKSDVKQEEGKTDEREKEKGSEIDGGSEVESDVKEKKSEADGRRSSKRGDSIDYQAHEMSDGRIAPAEKKKHKEKHADQGEVANEDEAARKRKKKESKKRKSEELVDGVSDGAEHQQRFKRKKVKQEDQ